MECPTLHCSFPPVELPSAHHHECHTDHITHPVTACGNCCNKLQLSISNGKSELDHTIAAVTYYVKLTREQMCTTTLYSNWDKPIYENCLNLTLYSALLVTSYCAEKIVSACHGSVSAEKVGQGEVGGFTRRVTCTWWLPSLAVKTSWLGPGGPILALAARLGCQSVIVGTGWANSCPCCMDRLRKRYSHLVGGWFLAGKAAWALSECLTTKSADYCMLINEWA